MATRRSNNVLDELQSMSENEVKRQLAREGRRLKYIALKLWRKDMSQYQPKSYAVHLGKSAGQRTRRSQRAIKLGRVKMIAPNQWGIELTWENELVYHDSMFPNQPQGHSVMLISEGWHSKKLEKKLGVRINRFTYFEGTNYIARVVQEWRRTAPSNITLEEQWSGKMLR